MRILRFSTRLSRGRIRSGGARRRADLASRQRTRYRPERTTRTYSLSLQLLHAVRTASAHNHSRVGLRSPLRPALSISYHTTTTRATHAPSARRPRHQTRRTWRIVTTPLSVNAPPRQCHLPQNMLRDRSHCAPSLAAHLSSTPAPHAPLGGSPSSSPHSAVGPPPLRATRGDAHPRGRRLL